MSKFRFALKTPHLKVDPNSKVNEFIRSNNNVVAKLYLSMKEKNQSKSRTTDKCFKSIFSASGKKVGNFCSDPEMCNNLTLCL